VSAILIISVFLIVVASFAILRTKRPPSTRGAEQLPPGLTPRGLFGDTADLYPLEEGAEEESPAKALAGALRARAESGDLEALADARASGDTSLYRFVLDGLVGRAVGSPGDLRALAAHIARGDGLRSSPALAEMLLGEWRSDPSPASTAELLRISALSDDAGTFGLVVSEVLQAWEEGRLTGVGAEELRALFEGEYWLLSSEAKRSGAGFVLKQKLADVRRRLASRARRPPTETDAGSPLEAPAQKERP
jgi:hypothetical protein